MDSLDGDMLVEIGILGEVSNTKSALAEHTVDAVPMQLVIGFEGIT
jgi:hypothetical protein